MFDSISGDVGFLPEVAKIPPAAMLKLAEIVRKEFRRACEVRKKEKYSLRLRVRMRQW